MEIPAAGAEELLDRAALVGTLDEPDPAGARTIQQRGHGKGDVGVGLVRPAIRIPAGDTILARTPGQPPAPPTPPLAGGFTLTSGVAVK